MNICFIVDYYPPDRLGGVGESARYLKEALEEAGHTCFVLTTGIQSEESSLEKHVLRVCKSLLFFPGVLLFTFPFILKKYKIEVIHVHHSIAITALFWKKLFRKGFPAIISTYKCSRPHIVHSIKSIRYNGKIILRPRLFEYSTKLTFSFLHFADRYLAEVSDYLTSNSNDTLCKNRETLKIPAGKISVVHNGVALEKYIPSKDGFIVRNHYSISDTTFLLMYVGGFSVRKRVPVLLYILKDLLFKGIDVKLFVIGSAKSYIDDFKKIVKSLRIEENVIFTGFVKNSNLPLYYAASDCIVVPSEYEPFGIINIEAMAMEKPVIASDVGGMSDIIEDSKTGFLIPKDKFDLWVDKIAFLAGNPAIAKAYGKAGKERVMKHFSWDLIRSKYIEVYNDAIRGRKKTR